MSETIKGKPEQLGKCKIGDVPLSASHKIIPVSGSIMLPDNGVDLTGVCPNCGTRVKLSTKGFLRTHVVRGESLPPSPALSEPNVLPTDTGARVGAPESQSKWRATEIDGAFERGTVSISVVTDEGRKRQSVPATVENLGIAIRQELGRRLTSDASLRLRDERLARLRRQRDAAMAGEAAMHAERAFAPKGGVKFRTSNQRDDQRSMLDGPAMVTGKNMRPVQPSRGWIAKAGTMAEPVGREGFDHEVLATEEIVGGVHGYLTRSEYGALSATRKRRYRAHIQVNKERAARARAYAGRRAKVLHECTPDLTMREDGTRSDAVALMGAPGRSYDPSRAGALDWNERQATSVR